MKPTSYTVAAQLGYQRENDQEEEIESKEENNEEQEGWESDEEEFNPYDKNLDIEVGAHVSHEDLKHSFAHLPQVLKTTKLGMRAEIMVIDKDVIAKRLVHLQKRGIILYTIDFNPLRDAFENQVYREIGKKIQIKIEQIKVIT